MPVKDLVFIVATLVIAGRRVRTDVIDDAHNSVCIVKQSVGSHIRGCQILGNVEWNTQYTGTRNEISQIIPKS